MSGRSRLAFAGLAAAALVAGLAVAFLGRGGAEPEVLTAGQFDPPRAAPEFLLAGSDGSEVTLARYRGKVVLLGFGYTHCAAVCPTTLATLAQARAQMGAAGERVQVIFVTVDPERDTAAQMKDYLAAFDPSFIGATGEPAALAEVREAYGVSAVREGDGPDYAMAHTSSIFLIDPAGRLRAMMPFGHTAADFAHDIALLLDPRDICIADCS